MINRIVLIGNGFDLAHGLKTSYKDFIDWYWEQMKDDLCCAKCSVLYDKICSLDVTGYNTWESMAEAMPGIFKKDVDGFDFLDYLQNRCRGNVNIKYKRFFDRISNCIFYQNWVDIENEYYSMLCEVSKGKLAYSIDNLNIELDYIKQKLIEYLDSVKNDKMNSEIGRLIIGPLIKQDICIKGKNKWNDFITERHEWNRDSWCCYLSLYHAEENPGETLNFDMIMDDVKKDLRSRKYDTEPCNLICRPDNILFLDFNYTNTITKYFRQKSKFKHLHIHGDISNPDSVIFGYGDELDEDFKRIENLNDNRYLKNIKSTCYMQSSNYRRLMEFMNTAPYQVIIMGHSCGNSDRTLLHALFEHENCISIKPYYYEDKDGNEHYTDMVQNIYRNFTNKADFRDKVVNIEYCEKMPQVEDN